MKICTLQIALALTFSTLVLAHNNFAQVLDKKITLTMKQVPLERALEAIEDVADVKFFYSIDQLDVEEKVSVDVKQQTLRVILDELLAPHQIKYKVHERKATITLRKERSQSSIPVSINEEVPIGVHALLTVRGRVTEAVAQTAMAGVNVLIKGTTIGTSTDADGRFSIEGEADDILVFSFIGYETIEERIGNRDYVTIVLHEDATTLKPVVLNGGYYLTTDKESTGNISKVGAGIISQQPVANPLQALQGRMPGVQITQPSGVTGTAMRIQIRGQNSLRQNGNFPLYVIDGVPINSTPLDSRGPLVSMGADPLNMIDPHNIESIEILKDADATAIYGSRGANGVVLITTKSGKQGKGNLEINLYSGLGKSSSSMDLLTTNQYVEMRNEAFKNDAATRTLGNAPDLLVWDTTRYTDWQKTLFGGTANISDFQASFSGGNNEISFRAGGGYHRETTVFPGNSGYARATFHLNLTNTSRDSKFGFNLSLNYGADQNDLFNNNIVSSALTLPPNAPALYQPGGTELNWENSTWTNPLTYIKQTHESKTNSLIANTVLTYQFFRGFTAKVNLGYTILDNNEELKYPISSFNPAFTATSTGSFTGQSNHRNSWLLEPQLTYSNDSRIGQLNILLGSTWQSGTDLTRATTAFGYTNDALLGNLAAAPNIFMITDNLTEYRYQAIFARVKHVLKEKYILSLTGRRDGSSRFGPDRRSANFGSIGAGWIFSLENFMKRSSHILSFGKLRGSYGTTGSDQVGDYQYLDTYAATTYSYQGRKGLVPAALFNPDFAWEKNEKLEAALDLEFLSGRMLLSSSWFRNRSSNQLVGFSLPALTGFTSITSNFPATVENTGWEIELTTQNVASNTFNFRSAMNITIPRNELISYPKIEESSYNSIYVVGQPLTIRKRYAMTGVDRQTGLYTFADIDENGVISSADRQVVVNDGRRYYGGLFNELKFKAITFNFFFEFVKQKGPSHLNHFSLAPGYRNYNQPVTVMDRWREDGDDAGTQRFTQASNQSYTNLQSSDVNSVDASFIRLKTVSLFYTLPAQLISKLKVSSCRIYVTSQNLYTFTRYKGLNPEAPGTNFLPSMRVITGGLNVKL